MKRTCECWTLHVQRTVAVVLFAVYVAWQVAWLAQGRLPPALLLAATGLPAPTTGGTRAVASLLCGDVRGSLDHNAMAVPLVVLFALSLAWPCWQWAGGRRMALPPGFGRAWVVVLLTAWVLKLVQAIG